MCISYYGIVFITATATDRDAVQAFGRPGTGSVDQSKLPVALNRRGGNLALSTADILQSSAGM